MKTNFKTSISIFVSGNFIYPDSFGSLSVFDCLDLYSYRKSSFFEDFISVEAPTIKVMLSRVFSRNFCCSKTSASILNTLNFYALKYPHLK